mgnify:FL=1
MQRKLTVIGAGITVAVLGAGAAIAFSMASDEAKVSDTKAARMKPFMVVSATTRYAQGETQLWPGHAAGVAISLRNPNEVGVKVTAAAFKNSAATGGTPDECKGFVTVVATLAVDGPVIAGNDGTGEVVLPDVLKLKADAPDQCQEATFKTTWTVTGSTV